MENDLKLGKWTSLMSGIGFAGGVALAFYKKTDFLKGWGIAIIGGIIAGGIGYGIDKFSENKK